MAKITVTVPDTQRDYAQKLANQSNLTLAQVLSVHVAQICNTQSLDIRQNNTAIADPRLDDKITPEATAKAIDDFKHGRGYTTEEMLRDLEKHAKTWKEQHKAQKVATK